jgi:methyl-accepting chemotaxis protein
MFSLSSDANRILSAISKSQAIIEFDIQGKVLTANESFCRTLGYELKEIVGNHHRMFCDPAYVATPAYHDFWARLGRGEYDAGTYKRFAKGNREIWIEASYNPVFRNGKPVRS